MSKRRLDEAQVGGDHYKGMDITPWEALEAWLTPEEFRGYLKGEAIVYLARERSKGGPVDIGKARHVLQKLEEADAKLLGRAEADVALFAAALDQLLPTQPCDAPGACMCHAGADRGPQ